MKKSKWYELTEWMIIHNNIAYNADLKAKFQRLGRSGLKELVTALEGTGRVKNCKISYNKAGIACSGDFHLKGDYYTPHSTDNGSFDLFFNLDCGNRFFTYRKTKSQTDYTGGVNNQMPFVCTKEHVAERILQLGPKEEEMHGTF